VARGELVLCIVWPDRVFERPWRVKSPEQIRLVVGKLLELNQRCPVTVAMESSGTYGDAFRQALDDAGLPVDRVSAKAVKDDSEGFDGVPSNHDGKDAAIIGTLCVNGRSVQWRWQGAMRMRRMHRPRRTRRSAILFGNWTPPSASSRSGAGSWKGCWRGTGPRLDG